MLFFRLVAVLNCRVVDDIAQTSDCRSTGSAMRTSVDFSMSLSLIFTLDLDVAFRINRSAAIQPSCQLDSICQLIHSPGRLWIHACGDDSRLIATTLCSDRLAVEREQTEFCALAQHAGDFQLSD